eukprot:Colp12_sorted_trinity150504_noHs@6653
MAPPRTETGELAIEAREKGPGPARYMLPTTVGAESMDATKHKMPSYSFGSKLKELVYTTTPGPAFVLPRIDRKGGVSIRETQQPCYSLQGRPTQLIGASANTVPGPGAHTP